MIETYTVKKGDTLAKVADFFDVSVKQLKDYNAPTLGLNDRFDVGLQLRNPNEIPMLVNAAVQNGATITDIASVLKITEDDARTIYDIQAEEVLQEEEPEVVIPKETLKEIQVLAQRRDPELFPVNVTAQRRDPELFPVNVTAQRRDPELFPVNVTAQRRELELPDVIIPDEALEEIQVLAKRRESDLPDVTIPEETLKEIQVLAQRRDPELFPVNVTAQRREGLYPKDMYRSDGSVKSARGFLGPVQSEDGRAMTEYSIGVQINGKETQIPSMVPGLTEDEIKSLTQGNMPESVAVKAKAHAVKRLAEGRSPFYQDGEEKADKEKLFPITVEAEMRQAEDLAKVQQEGIVFPKETMELLQQIRAEEKQNSKNAWRNVAKGLTMSAFDELEAFVASQVNDTPYVAEKARIKEEMDEYALYNPAASIAQEAIGLIPGSIASTKALVSMGVVKLPAQGAIEAGAYGFNSGDSVEERLILGGSSAVIGGAVGKVFEKMFDSTLVPQTSNAGGLKSMETDALQSEVSAQKIMTAPANMSDDEVVTQLLIRESEYLADVIGRQGAKPAEVGNTLLRLSQAARNMGVSPRQIDRVLNDKKIRDLTRLPDDVFTDPYALNAFRQDLLDNTAGRLQLDIGRTIPEAQSLIVKFRRLASPLATLAETAVGTAFSSRIVRGMNRVVRGQTQLDDAWKGMEQLRNLADDVKFNDLMLDAVNATNIGQKAATKAFETAKKYADAKIGKGAGDRLQKFFDDGVAFNSRYRREVTSGELSPIWMHSSTKAAAEDVSLRVNRARAAGKTEDAASKDRLRRSMEEERAKPLDKQKTYENIFDSHWRWQRETLTRMELGKQLGFRTSGKPVFAEMAYDDLPKRLQKAVDNESMTLMEASVYSSLTSSLRKKVDAKKMTVFDAAAKMEQQSFKLFDEKVITETLKREGYSDLQIKNAVEILDDLGVNAQRGMSQELDVVRNLGYVGTIANPYGALMNVHDLFNAAFEFGVGNVLKSVFDKTGIRFTADDMGLAQQVYGEFVRKAVRGDKKVLGSDFIDKIVKGSDDLLQWSMKASGFSGLDKYGKGKIMGASFRKARQDIKSGEFDSKWQYTFSKGELDQLRRDIASGNTDSELVRDMVMFDLFKLQPINAAAQTSYGLANPNARLFYMLKGFAIKQFDLMERRIFNEWKKGNKKEALTNAMKYLVISGGGYGVVNEARQVLKGEAPDPAEAAVGALYQVGSVLTFGAMGANDYGYAKFMEDPGQAMMVNIFPPFAATLPAAVLEDMADVVTKGDPLPDETIYALPVVGKTLKAVFD